MDGLSTPTGPRPPLFDGRSTPPGSRPPHDHTGPTPHRALFGRSQCPNGPSTASSGRSQYPNGSSTASFRRSRHPSQVFDRLMAHRSVESNRGPSPISGFIGRRDGVSITDSASPGGCSPAPDTGGLPPDHLGPFNGLVTFRTVSVPPANGYPLRHPPRVASSPPRLPAPSPPSRCTGPLSCSSAAGTSRP